MRTSVELRDDEVLTRDDLKEPLDYAYLKVELLNEGLRIEDAAREGLGGRYKEQIHFLFDLDFDHHPGAFLPAEIILPESPAVGPSVNEFGVLRTGLNAMVRWNKRSPFLLRREGERLLLEKQGNTLCDVLYYPRPPYYSRKTEDGTEMCRLTVHGGLQGLFTCFNHYCHYFKDGDECRFCNITTAAVVYPKDQVRRKHIRQVAEAVAGAWEDGICQRLVISGGILPGRTEIDSYIEAASELKKIKKWTDPDNLPVLPVFGAPAPDKLSDINRLREAGCRFAAINLEMGDPDWFKALCPGKAKNGGWENWVRAVEYAAEVFGFGNVRCNFVVGIEPMEDTLKTFKRLSKKGVFCQFLCWCANPGSMLWGHRAPTTPWYWEISSRLVDLYEESGLTLEQLGSLPGANDIPMFDIWRARKGKSVDELMPCGEI